MSYDTFVGTTPLLLFEILAIFLFGNLMNIKVALSDGARIQSLVIGFLTGLIVLFFKESILSLSSYFVLLLAVVPHFVFKPDRENNGSRLMLGVGASFLVSYTYLFLAVYLARSGSGEMALINACIPILFPYFSWICGTVIFNLGKRLKFSFFVISCLAFVFLLSFCFDLFFKEHITYFYLCFLSWLFWFLSRKIRIDQEQKKLADL